MNDRRHIADRGAKRGRIGQLACDRLYSQGTKLRYIAGRPDQYSNPDSGLGQRFRHMGSHEARGPGQQNGAIPPPAGL
jgi:hypothetical protein